MHQRKFTWAGEKKAVQTSSEIFGFFFAAQLTLVYIRDDSDTLFIEVSAVGICSLKFKVAAAWANDFILEPLF